MRRAARRTTAPSWSTARASACIFCSEPCRRIFESQPERYQRHKDVVRRVLAGEAPANLVAMLRQYFGLDYHSWGKDAHGGRYAFIERRSR